MVQLRELSALTYGKEGWEHPSIKQIKNRIHAEIWALRVRAVQKRDDRKYDVPQWKLHGQQVCKKAFMIALGGTSCAHRQALALTLRGIPPLSNEANRIARGAIRAIQHQQAHRTEWAITWWYRHLQTQDWLPNEEAIQYRGPIWEHVHKHMYLPSARAEGKELQRRQWRRALKLALDKIQSDFYPDWSSMGKKLKLVRSARHSKFPECTDCQILRQDYVNAVSKLGGDQNEEKQCLDRMIAHAKEWQAEREAAIRLRHASSSLESSSVYECDDKCGSYWQRLPIGETGRDTKSDSTAVYRFAIHANVVAGVRGVLRLTCVPKNVRTGANFGLTNLIMTLLSAKEAGRLPMNCTHLYRHTDGGPDNVAAVTHIINWLLIYLGIFQKITWFRFKAGHSHTEVADRLFSIMKRLFEADGQHRVLGITDIPQLVDKLKDAFKHEKEKFEFAFNFCNWDFVSWTQPWLGKLKNIAANRVYTYEYDEHLWEHGCVKVQYKHAVAWRGSSQEAEYGPVERQQREVFQIEGEGTQIEWINVSTRMGVHFVSSPPDLRVEPDREMLHPDFQPGVCITTQIQNQLLYECNRFLLINEFMCMQEMLYRRFSVIAPLTYPPLQSHSGTL